MTRAARVRTIIMSPGTPVAKGTAILMKPTKRNIACKNLRDLICALDEHCEEAVREGNEPWASMLDVLKRSLYSADLPRKDGTLVTTLKLDIAFDKMSRETRVVDAPKPQWPRVGETVVWMRPAATVARRFDVLPTIAKVEAIDPLREYATISYNDSATMNAKQSVTIDTLRPFGQVCP